MNKILEIFKNFIGLFKPQSFNDPYMFLLNQFGHICISFIFCYLTNLPYLVLVFWIVWETIHLIKSKNYKDFLEDLTFEGLGVLLFILVILPSFKIWLLTLLLGTITYTFAKFKL